MKLGFKSFMAEMLDANKILRVLMSHDFEMLYTKDILDNITGEADDNEDKIVHELAQSFGVDAAKAKKILMIISRKDFEDFFNDVLEPFITGENSDRAKVQSEIKDLFGVA